jgi:hypothetical protein
MCVLKTSIDNTVFHGFFQVRQLCKSENTTALLAASLLWGINFENKSVKQSLKSAGRQVPKMSMSGNLENLIIRCTRDIDRPVQNMEKQHYSIFDIQRKWFQKCQNLASNSSYTTYCHNLRMSLDYAWQINSN